MNKPLIFIIVAILGTATFLAAQPGPGHKRHNTWLIIPAEQQQEDVSAVSNPQARNEWEWVAFASYKFYKKYISSQDAISCTFEPSCSTYGLHAFRHLGFAAGLGATFDRLSRCHGWNRGAYEIDVLSGLNKDPLPLLNPGGDKH